MNKGMGFGRILMAAMMQLGMATAEEATKIRVKAARSRNGGGQSGVARIKRAAKKRRNIAKRQSKRKAA